MLRNVTSQPIQNQTAKLAGRRARIAGLRKRFIAVSTAVFVSMWIAIFAQLVSGHDPALAAHSTSSSQVASSSSPSGAASTGASSTGAASTGAASTGATSTGSGNSGSGTASPVTTHQS
jgi:cytoskeletal protein RodZ